MNLKGKIIQYKGNIYEIDEFELQENAAAYCIRCSRVLTDQDHQFFFNKSKFYYLPISVVLNSANHLSYFQFNDIIKSKTKEVWSKLIDKLDGPAFGLTPLETTSRNTYIDTFGNMEFEDLLEELKLADK